MSDNGNGTPAPAPTKEEIVEAVAVLWRAIPPGGTVRFVLPIQPAIVGPGVPVPTMLLVVHSPVFSSDFNAPVPRWLAYPERAPKVEVAP